MGRRGPAPTPVEQRVLRGNPGRRPLPDTVLVGGRPVPAEWAEPPATLPKDGRDWWCEVVPILCENGLLDRADRTIVELAALTWARLAGMRRVIASQGFFALGSVGQIRAHPATKMELQYAAEYRRFAQELGIGPRGRTELGLTALSGAALFRQLEHDLAVPDAEEPVWVDGSLSGEELDRAAGLPGV